MNSSPSSEVHVERFSPEVQEPAIRQEHFHRYVMASRFTAGKRVLDLGCGEGYGTWIISRSASEAVGMDAGDETISKAESRYVAENLSYVAGHSGSLPFAEKSFDMVVCFELIEHIPEAAQVDCLAQIKKVLKQDGVLLISTPNKSLSTHPNENPYHLREMDLPEFTDLIASRFKNVTLLGQNSYMVSDIHPLANEGLESAVSYRGVCGDGKLEFSSDHDTDPLYYIAVASDGTVQPLERTYFHESGASTAYYNAEIKRHAELLQLAYHGIYCAGEILKHLHLHTARLRGRVPAPAKRDAKPLQSFPEISKGHTLGRIPFFGSRKKRQINHPAQDAQARPILPARSETFHEPALSSMLVPLNQGPSIDIDATVTVVIPVYNGGGWLEALLQSIRSQKNITPPEVLIIDSGSTDGSPDVAERYGAKVVNIPQDEFNHGGTRNMALEYATGDFLLFTVQDALPKDEYWLHAIISSFLANPRMDALSVRQLVNDSADLYSRFENVRHNSVLGYQSDCISILPDNYTDRDLHMLRPFTLQHISSFDNVCSCVRRSFFSTMHFAPLANAEDMEYGVRLLKNRKQIGHLVSTGVFHWHMRTPDYFMKRNYVGVGSRFQVLHISPPARIRDIGFGPLMESICSTYNILRGILGEISAVENSAEKILTFIQTSLKETIQRGDFPIKRTHRAAVRDTDEENIEKLLQNILGEHQDIMSACKVKGNYIMNDLVAGVSHLADYVLSNSHWPDNGHGEIRSAIYKIFATISGNFLGDLFTYRECIEEVDYEMEVADSFLTQGICHMIRKTIKSNPMRSVRLQNPSKAADAELPWLPYHTDRLYSKYKDRPLKLGCKLLWYSALSGIRELAVWSRFIRSIRS